MVVVGNRWVCLAHLSWHLCRSWARANPDNTRISVESRRHVAVPLDPADCRFGIGLLSRRGPRPTPRRLLWWCPVQWWSPLGGKFGPTFQRRFVASLRRVLLQADGPVDGLQVVGGRNVRRWKFQILGKHYQFIPHGEEFQPGTGSLIVGHRGKCKTLGNRRQHQALGFGDGQVCRRFLGNRQQCHGRLEADHDRFRQRQSPGATPARQPAGVCRHPESNGPATF